MSDDLKVVVLKVGKEEYGIDINSVISIERMQPVTCIPKMSEHVIGIIQLRGVIAPLIDLRKIFGQTTEIADDIRIIAVSIQNRTVGLVVDMATDVLDVPAEAIQHLNLFDEQDDTVIAGIAKIDTRILILLHIENLIASHTPIDDLQEMLRNSI